MFGSFHTVNRFTAQSSLNTFSTRQVHFGENQTQAEARILTIMNELEPDLIQRNIKWPATRNEDGSYRISIGDKPFYLINNSSEANQAVGLPLQLGLISRVTGEEFRYTGAGCFSPPSAFYMAESGQPQTPVSLELTPRIQNFFMRLTPPALETQEASPFMADVQEVLGDLSQGNLEKVWKKLFG